MKINKLTYIKQEIRSKIKIDGFQCFQIVEHWNVKRRNMVNSTFGKNKILSYWFTKLNISNSLIRGHFSSNFLNRHGFSKSCLNPIRYYSGSKSSNPELNNVRITNKCTEFVIDKHSKEERLCRNYVCRKSKNFLCFVHEKKKQAPKSLTRLCDGVIISEWKNGVFQFCNRNVKKNQSFCGFHQDFKNSGLFMPFLISHFVINLSRILIIKEIFFKISIQKTVLKIYQTYYYKLYLYLTWCLKFLDRVDWFNFNYSEKITWNYFVFPIANLEPSTITILNLPISVLQLLIHQGQLLVLDNAILKLLFQHFRKTKSNLLFHEKFPILFEILSGKFNMEFRFFGRSLDLNSRHEFKKIFLSKLMGSSFDITWDDIVKHILFFGLKKLNFIKKIPTDFLNLWALLKMCCFELNKLRDFIWSRRVTKTYLNFFEKFKTTKEFRSNTLIGKTGRLKSYFVLLIANDYFVNLFTQVRVWLKLPTWLHFVKLGYLLINPVTIFSINDLNLYLARFFLISPEKPLFSFYFVNLDNSYFVNFLVEFFKINFKNNFSDSSLFYLNYRLKKNWLKDLTLKKLKLLISNFEVYALNPNNPKKFQGLRSLFKNDLFISIELFKNALQEPLVDWKTFLAFSVKEKEIYLKVLLSLAKHRSFVDLKELKKITNTVNFRLFYYLNYEYREFLINNLKKRSFFGYLYLFLKQSLKLISNKFSNVLRLLCTMELNIFIKNFVNWFLSKKIILSSLVKKFVKQFKVQRSMLQIHWTILNPILQKILKEKLATFFVKKMIFFLFLNKNLPEEQKKEIQSWIINHFKDDTFLKANNLLSIYLKLVAKFILCLVHSKVIRNKGVNFQRKVHTYKIRSWEIFSHTSGLKINSNWLTLPYLDINKPSDYTRDGKNKDNESLINPPIDGQLISTDFSETALNSINILQNSSFKINPIYLKILEKVDETEIKMPWPTKRDFSAQLRLLKKYAIKIPHLQFKIKAFIFLKKTYKNSNDFKTIACLSLRLSEVEFNLIQNFLKQLSIFKSFVIKRKFFLKTLLLATHLKNYTLSFSMFLDYRYRMYYLFSLGLGPGGPNYLKRLLNFSKKVKLTYYSFFYILRSYYSNEKLILKKLDDYFSDLEIKIIFDSQKIMLLINFFYCNPLILSKSNLSESLLKREILHIIRSKKFSSNIMLTIDQKASSLVFFSILFRDALLARKCNLITKKSNDVYLFFQTQLIKWLKSKDRKLSKGLKLIVKLFKMNRSLLKNSIMKFLYSQKWSVRLNDWVFAIKKILKLSFLNSDIYTELKWISINFENFISFVFPNLVRNLSLLKQIFRLSIKATNQVCFKSIDNSHLVYKFFHIDSKVIKIWDQKKKKYISIRVKSTSSKVTNILVNRYFRSLLPNLLHFIDSSVLRVMIIRLKNVIPLDQLQLVTQHDSFSISAAWLPVLYTELQSFYKKSSSQTWLQDIVIEPIKQNLKDEKDRKKVDKLFSKFVFGKKWSGRYFDIRNVYPPELK